MLKGYQMNNFVKDAIWTLLLKIEYLGKFYRVLNFPKKFFNPLKWEIYDDEEIQMRIICNFCYCFIEDTR
ncbi:hypothetical protein RclHR1_28260001 [Rhizophagus clarus]|nr:hypothetical protein RclHR1_28260001 [Rhizophagus clarus]